MIFKNFIDAVHYWAQGGGLQEDSSGNTAANLILSDKLISQIWHNRYITGVTATWPGNDTFSMTFTASEGVTRYRVLVEGGADGQYVKFCEDAVNEAQAESWLGLAASASANVNHRRCYTTTADANGSTVPLWTEWQEFPEGNVLSRLDFLASAAGPFTVFVEAE